MARHPSWSNIRQADPVLDEPGWAEQESLASLSGKAQPSPTSLPCGLNTWGQDYSTQSTTPRITQSTTISARDVTPKEKRSYGKKERKNLILENLGEADVQGRK